MKIIDAHCDVLWKMWTRKYLQKEPIQGAFYKDVEWLQVTKKKLARGKVALQACAVYVSEDPMLKRPFETALEMIHIFNTEVVSEETIFIRGLEDLERWQSGDRLGLLLTLEGAESIEGDLTKLEVLHQLGVRWVGLTHNPANQVADGVGEERGAGLSNFGKKFVEELNRLRIAIDVSHLSVRGFWDVAELSKQPFFASHSNTKKYLNHRRNLDDDQIKAILQADGMIGLTYVPYFTSANERVTLDDLLRHVEHVCSLGGARNLGFGSDFDGISRTIVGLEDSSQTENWVNLLLRHYPDEVVKGFLSENWIQFMKRIWS